MSVETGNDALDQDACCVIRELLGANGVPSAGFIDDHVRNAIAQRNILSTCLAELAATATDEDAKKIEDAFRRAYPDGIERQRLGDAVVRYMSTVRSL